MRLKVSHFLALVVVAALSVGLLAGPAVARPAVKHKMSAKQKAHVRAQLRRQIRHNPRMIARKSFLRKAALVNFKLPVTLRLRGSNTATTSPTPCPYSPDGGTTFFTNTCNPGNGNGVATGGFSPGNTNGNKATLDLGASLGTREVDLGGKLAAEIVFHDSFDGGALGNVDLTLLPGKSLTSTSIPLLWNTQVSQAGTAFESNDLYNGVGAGKPLIPSGCGNLTRTNTSPAAPSGSGYIPFGNTFLSGSTTPSSAYGATNVGLPGYPVTDAYPASGFVGYLPIQPGINDTANTGAFVNVGPHVGTQPGNNDILGGAANPFPVGASSPSGFYTGNPTPKDTVLRTNALDLTIATGGFAPSSSVDGGENITLGKSGGQANLFGNIPGKSYGIDVTVNLATRINSIIRVVDQDSAHTGVYGGQFWPAGLFNCQQVWTGGVDNFIPDVRLVGNLKISPGLTTDGHLRIAKATVSTPGNGTNDAHFGVAACLMPWTTYAKRNTGTSGEFQVVGPTAGSFSGGYANPLTQEPVDPNNYQAKPTQDCNSAPDSIITNSALPPSQVGVFAGSPTPDSSGYFVTGNGSKVSVAADLHVNTVSLDVLIGDV